MMQRHMLCSCSACCVCACPLCCCSSGQRIKARVLYVDPASKRVGLTLAPHLLAFSLPPNFPLLGQVRDG